ncbi:MAG: hypothetical protein WD423_10365 [Rhodothermales bacterium]
MVWRLFFLITIVAVSGLPASVVAQSTPTWRVQIGGGYMHSDGESSVEIGLGTVVTTDVGDGIFYKVRVERRFTESLGISLSGFTWSDHDFIRQQTFSDGSTFESRDAMGANVLALGVVGHFLDDGGIHVVADLFILYAWYEDLLLEGPGPPFGDGESIAVRPDSRPGMGLIVGLEIPLGTPYLSLNPWAGAAVAQFTEAFFDASRGASSTVDVPLSPVMAGVSLGFRF